LALPVRIVSLGVVAAAGLIGAVAGGREVRSSGSLTDFAVSAVTRGGDAFLLTLLLLAAGWHLRSRQLRRPPA
jgi:hypothetical protein